MKISCCELVTGSVTGMTGASIDPTTAAELLAQQIENRQQLIRDVIEKEHDFIEEMQNLFHVYLEPLEQADMYVWLKGKILVKMHNLILKISG